jgi:hypothetical protein
MTELPATIDDDEPSSITAEKDAEERRSNARYYDDLISFGWPRIGLGIILSGGVYPIVLCVGYLIAGILFSAAGVRSYQAPSLSGQVGLVVGMMFTCVVASLFLSIIGLMWASFVTVLTLPVLHLVVWSMRLKPKLIWLGAFAGGFVAFVATLPICWRIPHMLKRGDAAPTAVILLAGPALATIVGQLGGARGGKRGAESLALNRMSAKLQTVRLRYVLGLPSADSESVSANEDEGANGSPRFQFRIFHILWIGVWFSLLFTLIRVSGIPYEFILPLFLGWLVYQAGTLALGRPLLRRLGY